MPLVENAWYVNYGNGTNTGYYALAQWTAATAYVAGNIIRQLAAPAVNSERVFICVVAGTSHATTEPTWTLTRGAKTTDNTVTWQECSGIAGINGDLTNTPSWTVSATPPGGVKNTAVVLGQVIKRDSGASYQICTTAGTAGNGAEPAFSNTAGTTTADNTVTWTSLGAVGNFTGWQAPHARCANAVASTWAQAGNKVFVGDNHAETQGAAISISAGTIILPVYFYCVDKAGSLPPVSADLKTTATITTTGAFGISFNVTDGANLYWTGFTFNVGTGSSAANFSVGVTGGRLAIVFENCTIALVTTSASSVIGFTSQQMRGGKVRLKNTVLSFGAVGQSTFVNYLSNFLWSNTLSAIGGTVPTNLFNTTGSVGVINIVGVDLSAAGSGKTLVGNGLYDTKFVAVDCKLGASVTAAATPAFRGATIDFIRCDSGATNYTDARYTYEGTQLVETTIVRTSGATDGTTLISWKFTSTANSNWVEPFESQPITIWNDSTSAITTLTFYGTTTGGGVPNNDDISVEVEYLGSSATPQGSFIVTTKADGLAASASTNNSSDGSTWGGSGAGNGFKIVVPSFTPGMKGPINIVIKVAKASSTYYIDPKPSISGVTVSKSEILAPGVYANELSSGSGGISRARAFSGF